MTEPLGIRPTSTLSDDKSAALQRLQAYDLSRLRERLLSEGVIPAEWVDEALLEFRRFLGLIVAYNRPLPMFSPVVDEVWHSCILFTRTYADLCEQAVGRFIHHEPTTDSEASPSDNFAEFKQMYEELYGPLSRMWRVRRREK